LALMAGGAVRVNDTGMETGVAPVAVILTALL